MTHRCQVISIALAVMLVVSAHTTAVTVYVSPDGNDAWSGMYDKPNLDKSNGPLATLTAARDVIRKLRAGEPNETPVRIIVCDGIYTMTQTLELTAQDSGQPQTPVVYQAAAGAKPVFSGGVAITGWQPHQDGIWKTHLPEVAHGKWYFEQLFVDGRRAVRARTPNEFYYYMQSVRETRLENDRAVQTIKLHPETTAALAGIDAKALNDVQMVAYHKWDITRKFLRDLDIHRNAMRIEGGLMKSWNPLTADTPFFFENAMAFLDTPGEWFLARDGWLYYQPLPGEDMANVQVIAPRLEQFIRIQGSPADNQIVEHIQFKGLAFEHGQYLSGPEGFEPQQAAVQIGAAVHADGARNIVFEDCRIAHIGTYAMWFRDACTTCTVRRCHITDTGAGGIKIGSTAIAANLADQTSHILVDNNILHAMGYLFPCAVGVWIGHSPDNIITHNEIADLYYTAVSVGWRWGYDHSPAKRNRIDYNYLHHIGYGVLSDMGAVYTLGPSEGTTVNHNVIHDVYAFSYGGWGLYTDEGSSNIEMAYNLVYRTKTGGFHQHFGKDNHIHNNIFIDSELAQLQASRVEEHLSFIFDRNIIYFEKGALLNGPWDRIRVQMDNNCYYRADSGTFDFAGMTFEQWQKLGRDTHSIIADPKFTDISKFDGKLAADSPAFKLGFKAFKADDAGVYGPMDWVRLARSIPVKPLKIAPPPPPVAIDDDFEDYAPGAAPAAENHVENKGDAIVITDDTAAAGKHCLKIQDAAGLSQRYNLHLVYRCNYPDGTADCSFDLKVTDGCDIVIEGRDYNKPPYQTGPNLSIRDGQLHIPGKSPVALPADTWIHVQLHLELTGQQWSITWTPAGQSPQSIEKMPMLSKDFHTLQWVGFISNADAATTFYLDNFKLYYTISESK